MSVSVLYMSMSLDGYIAGSNDEVGNPGGDDFDRLHEWMWEDPTDGQYIRRQSGSAAALWDEMDAFGAIVAGRRTVEQVDHWGGDRHGVRIFVPSHRPPGRSVANYPLVTYVSDGIASAMAQAKAAAQERYVLVQARTRRSARSRPGFWTSCRSTRSRCCSVVAVGCSRCCHRASSWRSFG